MANGHKNVRTVEGYKLGFVESGVYLLLDERIYPFGSVYVVRVLGGWQMAYSRSASRWDWVFITVRYPSRLAALRAYRTTQKVTL